MSAEEVSSHRLLINNNFGALRLLAAMMVIYGHGLELEGAPPFILWNFAVSRIGLDLFFCISGYLVYDSWLRDPTLGVFLAKRALRIFPALIVCVLLTVFVLGPSSTKLPLSVYFTHHGTWQYLLNIALYLKLYLPGLFTLRQDGGAVNGSLWSLFPEVLCYLALPLVWLSPRRGRPLLLLVIGAACGASGLYMFNYHPDGYGLIYSADPKYVLVQVPFFTAGAFWREVQLRAPNIFRLDLAVILCASNFVLPLLVGTQSVYFEWLTLSYVLIALGRASTPLLCQATMFGDLSYGAYLYAFPVQQRVLDHMQSFAIPICTAITLVIALLSWHLIEQPALRLKPQRGRRLDVAGGLPTTVAPEVQSR